MKKYLLCLCAALLLCCQMAAAQGDTAIRLTDFDPLFIPYDGPGIDAIIDTDIQQTGGEMDGVTVRIQEAAYVGNMLRFLLVATPTRAGLSLVPYEHLNAYTEMEKAARFGDEILALRCTADLPLSPTYSELQYDQIQGETLYYFCTWVDDPTPETVPVTLDCTLIGLDMHERIDETKLSFTIERTGTPEARDFDTDFDVEVATIDRIVMQQSALDFILRFEYTPQTEDGILFCGLMEPDGTLLQCNGWITDLPDGRKVDTVRWELAAEIPPVLYFCVQDSTITFRLDTQTGVTEILP